MAGSPWLLVVAADAGEALAPLRSLLLKAVGITVLMLLVGLMVMAGVVQRMMRGLDSTREAMEEVGDGDGVEERNVESRAREPKDVAAVGRAVVEIERVEFAVLHERLREEREHRLLALVGSHPQRDDVA